MTNHKFTQQVIARASHHYSMPTGHSLDLFHATVGLVTESGELMDAFKRRMFYGKELDLVNVKEELGDVLWYVALAAHSCGWTIEQLMQANCNKLEKRYGPAFSTAGANIRDLDAERKVLEKSA